MSERTAARILRDGALFPDMTAEAETYLFARNFHHQLKAQLLHKEVVLQVIRETTLDPTLELDRFGNPTPAPCRSVRVLRGTSRPRSTSREHGYSHGSSPMFAPRVCYVGLVFKRDMSPAATGEACCAAQMFLNSGNGVVFRGALGPWYSEERKEFHLRADACSAI